MMSVDASPLNGVGPYQLPIQPQHQHQLQHQHQHQLPQQPFPHLNEHRGSLDDLAYAFSQVQTFQPMPVSLSPPPLSSSASPTLLPTNLLSPPLDGSCSSSASATASTLVFDQIAHVAQTLASTSSPTPSLLGDAVQPQQQQQQPRARAAAAAQGLSLTTANLAPQPMTHATATPPSAIMSAASPMSAHTMLMSPSSMHAQDANAPCAGSGSDSDGGSSSTSTSTSNGGAKRGSGKKLSNASSTGSAAAAASEAAAAADGEKQRSRLTRDQMSALKRVYAVTYFPDKQTKEQLSRELNIPVRTIQIWFQNQRQYHRIKMKKKATQQASQSQVQAQAHQQTTLAAAHQQAAAVAQQQAMIAAMSGAVPPPSANPGLVVNTNASITTVSPACGPGATTPFSPSPFLAAPPAPSPGADSGIGSATPTTPFGTAASPFPGQPGPQTTRRNSAPPHFFGQVPTSLPAMPPVAQLDQPMVYQSQQQQHQQQQRRGSIMIMPTAMPTLHEHQAMYNPMPADQSSMLAPAPQYGEYNPQQQQQAFPSATPTSSQQFDMLFSNTQAMVAPAAEPLVGCNVATPVPMHQYGQQQHQVFSPVEHAWQPQQQQYNQQQQQQQQPMIQRGRSYSNTFF